MTTAALITGRPTEREIHDQLIGTVERRYGRLWLASLGLSGAVTLMLFWCIGYNLVRGVGVWGPNIPAAWGFAIVNFVFWIGIGHAGTFISAILLVFEQRWRSSINRFAEAMTLFAVAQAAIFPVLHLGRPWFFYWLVPYPSTMAVWPQVKSPLPWDFAAVTTYGIVSLVFWYIGLIPDLAGLRDSASTRRRRIVYGIFALGFRNDSLSWRHYRAVYIAIAGIATALVISVHSVVSTDFAVGLTPGWHSTLFPPYFVGGAVYSGFAMVLVIVLPARRLLGLENVITARHIDSCAKLLLVAGWVVIYGYMMDFFLAWYSGSSFERYQMFAARPMGWGAGLFWTMLICNCAVPQLFWSKRMRKSSVALFVGSALITLGMWSERFVIVVMSQEHEFLPSVWHSFRPTLVEVLTLVGTFGFFTFLFLLFTRFLPFVSVSETKELRREIEEETHV